MELSLPLPWKFFSAKRTVLPACLGAVVLACAGTSFGQAVYSWSGASGGSFSNASNWTYVSGTGSTYPGGGTSTNDTAQLNSPNNVVIYGSALPAGTLGSLVFVAGAAGDVNEFDDQYQTTTTPAVTGLTISNLITLGSGTAGTGTELIFLDPQTSATAGPVQILFNSGLNIQAGGVLELGSQNGGVANGSAVYVASGQAITLNGGTIEADRAFGTGNPNLNGGETIGKSSNEKLIVNSGSIVVGNYDAAESGTAASSADTLFVNSLLQMNGGSIVAGIDPHSTNKPQLNILGAGVNYIASDVTLDAGITYDFGVGNPGGTLESDVALPNLIVSQFGTYTDKIGAHTAGGTMNLGSFTVQQSKTTTGTTWNSTVQLTSNVALTSGASMLAASDSANSGFNPTNTLDTNGFVLDLTQAGSGTTTFTPNNSNSNNWVFTDSSGGGGGTVKAYAFNFTAAAGVSTTGKVTLQATGGNGSANKLAGTFGAATTFLYSGSSTETSAATLTSTSTIGALAVKNGVLNIAQANLNTGGGVSVTTSGGLLLNTASAAGTVTMAAGNLDFTLGSGGVLYLKLGTTNDAILANGGTGSNGNFSLSGGVIDFLTGGLGAFSYGSYQIFQDFLASGNTVSGVTYELNGVALSGYTANISQSGLLSFAAAPEPATWALLGAGAACLALAGCRRARA